MEYTTLGNTGMTVSRLCLGCMSFGSTDWREWVLEDEEECREIIETAIDLGITFFDTANIYSYGESERILGDVLADYDRNRQVIATKVNHQMDEENPNSGGLSRKAIEQELENSLQRLGVETVDLLQIHRYDGQTSITETLRSLDDAVRRGLTRYIGASSMWTHQFADAIHTSRLYDLERFSVMQNHYNLVYREEEREMLPFCQREGIGVIPWSPLARGYLARPHSEIDSTRRGDTEEKMYAQPYRNGGGIEINERVEELAAEKDVSMAQIGIAWLLHKDVVDAPIIGTTDVEHLREAVEALEISLSMSDIEYLEEPYRPVRVDW